MPSQQPPRLGGLALPLTTRTLRKESLDVYGPLLKAHQDRLWSYYISLQNGAEQVSLDEHESLLDAEVDAYLQWRAIGCLQRWSIACTLTSAMCAGITGSCTRRLGCRSGLRGFERFGPLCAVYGRRYFYIPSPWRSMEAEYEDSS